MSKLKRFECNAWRNFDYCVVCSEIDKNIIQKYDKMIDVTVIPNTIEIEYYQPQSDKIPYNLAFMGACRNSRIQLGLLRFETAGKAIW